MTSYPSGRRDPSSSLRLCFGVVQDWPCFPNHHRHHWKTGGPRAFQGNQCALHLPSFLCSPERERRRASPEAMGCAQTHPPPLVGCPASSGRTTVGTDGLTGMPTSPQPLARTGTISERPRQDTVSTRLLSAFLEREGLRIC